MAIFPPSLTKVASSVGGGIGKIAGSAFELLDPSNARRAISGLFPGGGSSADKIAPTIGFGGQSARGGATAAGEDDWRVRISLADKADYLYKDPSMMYNSILAPLKETNGVIWPYVPQVQVQHVANYASSQLTHSNYPAHFYTASEVADISITGEFTVQSAEEGQYLMAVIYFLRAATKMFFGQSDNAGNPPPMVFLDGYGSHYFPHVPGVITNFTHTLPNEVDYIQVPITVTKLQDSVINPGEAMNAVNAPENRGVNNASNVPSHLISNKKYVNSQGQETKTEFKTLESTTRVPTVSTVSVTFRPMYSRKNLHDRFNLNDFANGKLIQDKDKGFGGFI